MGQCTSKPAKEIAAEVKSPSGENNPIIDGKEGHLTLVPSPSGHIYIGASSENPASQERDVISKALSEHPEVADQMNELGNIWGMGVQINASESPAFLGLLVATVESMNVYGCKNPEVQVRCEGDKGVYLRHNKCERVLGAKPGASSIKGGNGSKTDGTSGPLEPALTRGISNASGSTSMNARDFCWTDADFVFVVAYSHADMTIAVRDAGMLGGVIKAHVGEATIPISDLAQGTHMRELTLTKAKKEVGTVKMKLRYEWMRGTQDTGKHFFTDKITIDSRKRHGMKMLMHISNVNHWLLSHDNVWCALPESHPALGTMNNGLLEKSLEKSGYLSSSEMEMKTADIESTPFKDGGPPAKEGVAKPLVTSASSHSNGYSDSDAEIPSPNPNASPYSKLMIETLAEALSDHDDDGADVKRLKNQLAHCMALMSERVELLEGKVFTQNNAILELEYKLDASTNSSKRPYISGRFGYGLGRPAAKREVMIFIRRAQDGYMDSNELDETQLVRPALFLGGHKTDSAGDIGRIEVPAKIVSTAGHYNVVALLPQDNTFAKGSLYILKPGTQCVVMDVDGTLTVGDQEVVGQFALNALAGTTDIGDRLLNKFYDIKQRCQSRTLARVWAAKGYQPVYLSGRQGSFYNITLAWLVKHGYPPGPIHLTRTHMPTMPLYYSVGNFKVQYMEMLKSKGFEIYAAYGNTGTDVRAYAAAGVPKERTYMIGQASGSGGTVALRNWTRHLPHVLSLPDATVPIPYVDPLWSDIPDYRRRADAKKQTDHSGHLPPSATDVGNDPKLGDDENNDFDLAWKMSYDEIHGDDDEHH